MIHPKNIKPNKHRAFRILKKWFNRYQREVILMSDIHLEGVNARIADVRLIKNPNNGLFSYKFTASTHCKKRKPKPKLQSYIEEQINLELEKLLTHKIKMTNVR